MAGEISDAGEFAEVSPEVVQSWVEVTDEEVGDFEAAFRPQNGATRSGPCVCALIFPRAPSDNVFAIDCNRGPTTPCGSIVLCPRGISNIHVLHGLLPTTTGP